MNHTKELIERAHRGDEKARETLVLENMGLIGSIVRRFAVLWNVILHVYIIMFLL